MMIGTSDPDARTSRAKSRPSPSGSIRSSNTRSNPEGHAARASPSEPATTGSNPSRVRALENGPEIEGSSSTNSTRGFTPATARYPKGKKRLTSDARAADTSPTSTALRTSSKRLR